MTEKDIIIKICDKFKISYEIEIWENGNGVIKTKSHELGHSDFEFDENGEIIDLY